MKILYYNNCWFTNVGEAFIDIGGLYLTKELFHNLKKDEEYRCCCISSMSEYYAQNAPIRSRKSILLNRSIPVSNDDIFKFQDLKADYLVIPGMIGNIEFLNAPSRKKIDKLVRDGIKLVLLGLGCYEFTEKEFHLFGEWIKEVKPVLIISRDKDTYNAFKDMAPCVNGIDCAFWSINSFDPRGFSTNKYDIITYNRSLEPLCYANLTENIVRPMHMQYTYRREDFKKNLFISDSPYDYLSLYANGNKVYTDLVHATVVSLMYGVPVNFTPVDKRKNVIEAIDNLKNNNGWLSVAEKDLNEQKKNIINASKKLLFKSIDHSI